MILVLLSCDHQIKQQKYLIFLIESELILCPIHHISVKLKTNMPCVSICLDVSRE